MKIFLRHLCVLLSIGFYSAVHAQVPAYSSYPSAEAVIFLDFDGHTVYGTSWNYNGPILCNASGLTNAQIAEVFDRVAEDYRPFNINITTDSAKFLAAPVNKRMRVVVTTSSSWYGSAGGVAFIGSFTWGDDSPCFVFSALLNYNVKFISEASSHEVGHTLGMYHQASYDANCAKTTDYNGGQGSGEIGWAPIMGVGYYKNFTLWNNGPNSFGCNNFQNDLSIITSAINGFGYRTDDHGNSFDSTTQSMFSNNEFIASGVIERNTDQDLFSFNLLATGRFTLDAIPYNVGSGNSGSDLDMQVTLYSSSQTVLNIYNPGTLLNSVIDTFLNTGTYYLKVEGKGNQYAPAYASLGSYSLRGAIQDAIVLPLYRIQLSGSQNGDQHQLSWEIEADEKIEQLILEVSADGRNFNTLAETSKDSRFYIYKPSVPGTELYRLKVLFKDGYRYYSNLVTIRNNEDQVRPKLVSTIINSDNIYVSSPGNYIYSVIDFNGKIIRSGKLTTGLNTIPTGNMIAGMYIIRFNDNGQQWTDKMIRP